MASKFEKWWENEGYFLAKQQNVLEDPVEIARLAYESGLFTSPEPLKAFGNDWPSHQVKCTCTCQILEVERFDYKDGDQGFLFATWSRGHDGHKLSWKERIRWCWDVIRKGKPWGDDIIVTNHSAKGLAEFILQNLPDERVNCCPICNTPEGEGSSCGYCTPNGSQSENEKTKQ